MWLFNRKANCFRRTETSAVWNLDKICRRRHLHFSQLPQQVSSWQRVHLHYRRWPAEECLYLIITVQKPQVFYFKWREGKVYVTVINLFKRWDLEKLSPCTFYFFILIWFFILKILYATKKYWKILDFFFLKSLVC